MVVKIQDQQKISDHRGSKETGGQKKQKHRVLQERSEQKTQVKPKEGSISKATMERSSTSPREILESSESRGDNIVEPERHKRSVKRGIMKTITDKLSNLPWSSNQVSLKSGDKNKSCQSGPNTSLGRERIQSSYAFERENSQKLSFKKYSPNERKFIRSVSDLGQVKFSAMKFKKHSRTRVAKKEMAKDWHNTYLEMFA